MKKAITLFVTIIMLFVLCIPAFAYCDMSGEYTANGRCMLRNPYYREYYNELLEQSYSSERNEYLMQQTVEHIRNDSEEYVTVILKDSADITDYKESNLAILNEFFEAEDILYTADRVPAAVVLLNADVLEKILSDERFVYVDKAFFNRNHLLISGMLLTIPMGCVCSQTKVTAADARYILRLSAKLEKPDKFSAKMVYFGADMDHDDNITVSDARSALRVAAGLETNEYLEMSYADYSCDFKR